MHCVKCNNMLKRAVFQTIKSRIYNYIFSLVCICISCIAVNAQVPHIKPSRILDAPVMSYAEYKKLYEEIDSGKYTHEETAKFEMSSIYKDLYSPACSWYCAGVIEAIRASSTLAPTSDFTYNAGNAHDFNHESAWAEGVDGNGIGEYIIYQFPATCPRVTGVKILNGYAKNERLWKANNRIKSLKVYYNGKEYAILELEDTRCIQFFEIGTVGYGPYETGKDSWTLKFEILDVYPGDKYDETVISELYFDGIDSH